MKNKLNFFLVILLAISFTNCSEPEDLYYNTKTLYVNNVIQITTLPKYKINDIIYLNASFSRYLPETGYTDLLDIFKTTKSNQFQFDFYLEKKSAYGNWIRVDFSDKILVEKGRISSYYSYSDLAICILNPKDEIYEFKAGLPLLESGEYRLSVNREIRLDYYQKSKFPVSISTNINNIVQGYYSFTVE